MPKIAGACPDQTHAHVYWGVCVCHCWHHFVIIKKGTAGACHQTSVLYVSGVIYGVNSASSSLKLLISWKTFLDWQNFLNSKCIQIKAGIYYVSPLPLCASGSISYLFRDICDISAQKKKKQQWLQWDMKSLNSQFISQLVSWPKIHTLLHSLATSLVTLYSCPVGQLFTV